jgi:hypothetical protein
VVLSFSKCKHAVQLTMYALFLKENYGFYPSETSIFSLTDVNRMAYVLNSKTKSLEEICVLFKPFLEELLEEIFDKNECFEHNEDSKYCNYCE